MIHILPIMPSLPKSPLQNISCTLKSFLFSRNISSHLLTPTVIYQNNPLIFSFFKETLRTAILKTYSLLTLSKVCFFAVPISLKYGINYLQNPLTAYLSPFCFITYGISSVLLTVFEGKKAQYCAQISLQAWKDISLETYRHLLNLDVTFHYNSSQKSRLFSLYKAHQYIEKNIRQFLNYLLPLSMDFCISGAYLWLCFGSEFFITFMSTILLYAAFTLRTSSGRRPIIFQQKENDKLADFIISESLANFYTVKHFNAEELQLRKYAKVLQKYLNFNLTNTGSLWQLNLGQKIIFVTGLTTNLVLAVWKVQTGALTAGDVVFLQALMMQIMGPLNFLGNFYREYSESIYEMKELFILLARRPKY